MCILICKDAIKNDSNKVSYELLRHTRAFDDVLYQLGFITFRSFLLTIPLVCDLYFKNAAAL